MLHDKPYTLSAIDSPDRREIARLDEQIAGLKRENQYIAGRVAELDEFYLATTGIAEGTPLEVFERMREAEARIDAHKWLLSMARAWREHYPARYMGTVKDPLSLDTEALIDAIDSAVKAELP